jgi:hypothetical protein
VCPLDGELRPPPPPPPPEERPTVEVEEVEARFLLYGKWVEMISDKEREEDGTVYIMASGRPLFFRHEEVVRVPTDVADNIRRWRASGWRR